MLKRILICVLCLSLGLLSPLSSLAEPLPWLEPWINLTQQKESPVQGEITLSLSPESWVFILDLAFSTAMVDQTFQGMQEEDVELIMAQINGMISAELDAVQTMMGALSALLKEMSVSYIATNDSIHFFLIFNNQPILTYALTQDADGRVLLLSDLHPSYALALDQKAVERILRKWNIYTDINFFPEDTEAQPNMHSAQILAKLNDFNLLEELIEMGRMELEALADHGHALRQQDEIIYTGQQEEKAALLEEMDLPYSPYISWLNDYLLQQQEDVEDESEDEFTYGLIIESIETETDAALEQEIPFVHTYSISGDTLRHINARMIDYTYFDEITDEATGITTRKTVTSQWENGEHITITPTSIDIASQARPDTLSSVTLDISNPHQLLMRYTLQQQELERDGLFTLSRTDEGQRLEMTITPNDPQTSLRILGSWNNDVLANLHLSLDLEVTENQWEPLFALSVKHAEYDLPALLSPEGLTVITPNRNGAFDDPGYLQELNTAAKPNLNLLVLTQLPQEARPLLTTLLGAISSLGQ